MNAAQIFKLPDLGEGLTESEVLKWNIEVGQEVALNQVIAEVETAKAVVELPSPYAGVVQQLHAQPGETVPVGSPLVTFAEQTTDSGAKPTPVKPERTPTLVGYGAEPASGKRPARKARRGHKAVSAPTAEAAPPAHALAEDQRPSTAARSTVPRSTPPVRKLARDHGVDLASVRGTGRQGLILRADVQALIDAESSGSHTLEEELNQQPPPPETQDRVVKLSALRRATAKAMVESAFTAPHATEFLTVDVTASLELIEQLRQHPSLQEQHVNFTTFLALIVSRLLQTHRVMNSSWDGPNDRIIEHGSVNLGMAVSSDRGLLVPVIRSADRLSLKELAGELSAVIEQGRAGTLSPSQLTGGTFSITNVGVFGVDAGTPILPPGQSAIVAIGQIKPRPWEYRGELALRQTATLALSFDHRLIDGKEGSMFLADLGRVLENPGLINLFV